MVSSENRIPSPRPLGVDKRGEPRCLRPLRYNRWLGLGVESLAAGAVFYGLYWLGVPALATWLVAEVAALILAEWVKWTFFGRYRKQLLTRVIEHELAACLRCGYPLTGLGERHRCPECGTPFHLPATKGAWERWFAFDDRGRVSKTYQESLRRHLEDTRRMRSRRTCIRCGHDLTKGKTQVCPECGATHEIPPDFLSEHWLDT